jgi:hypothetical protein
MTTATQTEIITVAIDIPLGELPPGYETQLAARGRINFGRTHLQVQLKQDEAEVMLRLREGLIDSRAVLENGQRVVNNADALRWLLSQLKASASQPQSAADPLLKQQLEELTKENLELKGIIETAMEKAEKESEASEDELIAEYLNKHGLEVTNKEVMEFLREKDVIVQSPQVTAVKKQLAEKLAE